MLRLGARPGCGSPAAPGSGSIPDRRPAVIFSAIGVRRCLVICSVVTEDAQSRMRGYGPFQEGTEPTAQITVASSPSAPPAGPTPPSAGPGPASPALAGGSPVAPPPDNAQPMSPDPSESTYTSAQPSGGGNPHPAQPSGDGPYLAQPGAADPYPAQPSSGGPYRAQPGAADPYAAQPSSGGPYPGQSSSADPYPAQPGSGGPYLAQPSAADPYSAQPSSGGPYPGRSSSADPYSAQPSSGGPYSAQLGGADPHPADQAGAIPTSGAGYPAETGPLDSTGLPVSGTPYDFTPAASYGPFRNTATPQPPAPVSGTPAPTSGAAPDFTFTGRRIEPSPPPDRNRLIIGLVAGLVAGLLLFGTAGYFVGRSTSPQPTAAPTTPGPTPTGSLGIFEQNQVAQNQAHFTSPALTPLAQGWLPYLSTCSRNGEPGGPVPNPGEKTRVRCTLSGMSVVFVEYASIADRDKARVKTLGQNVDARTLTPGVGAAMQRPAPSARTTGNYVEYAYKLTEGRVVRTVAGIWWDDAQTPVAAYLLAYWKEGVSESWEPMRDLWSRYA